MVTAFGKLLKKIVETIDHYGLQKKHLQKHIKETEKFYKKYFEVNYKSELANKYVKRLKKHWNQLWTFLDNDNVPWNNNNAEMAVKAFAMYRRGINGQVSATGLTEYLSMLSIAQTCRYRNISFLLFLRRKKGIWQNVSADALPDHLPFQQARMFVHSLNLNNESEWNTWCETKKRPHYIPPNPELAYHERGWTNWNDWIGTNLSNANLLIKVSVGKT